jgi:hypothetical protein
MSNKVKKQSARKLLSDTYIKSQKAAPAGERVETIDLDHHRLQPTPCPTLARRLPHDDAATGAH